MKKRKCIKMRTNKKRERRIMKKYNKIVRSITKLTRDNLSEFQTEDGVYEAGDSIMSKRKALLGREVTIEEKLDGSNASIKREGTELKCYSRNKELDAKETLNGFYNYVQGLRVEDFKEGYIYFGEWLVKHTIVYKEENYKNFYCFDIYEESSERYLSNKRLEEELKGNGSVVYREPLYKGKLESMEQVEGYAGVSEYTEEGVKGEGVVMKLQEEEYRSGFAIKFLNEEFLTKKATRPQKREEERDKHGILSFALAQHVMSQIVSDAVIEKEIARQGYENIALKDNKEVGTISGVLSKAIYEDMKVEHAYERDIIGPQFGREVRNNVNKYFRENGFWN